MALSRDWLCNQKHLLDPLIVLCSRAWKHEVARTLLARLWDYPDSNIDAVAQQKFRLSTLLCETSVGPQHQCWSLDSPTSGREAFAQLRASKLGNRALSEDQGDAFDCRASHG